MEDIILNNKEINYRELYRKVYYLENREYLLAYARCYYWDHRDFILAKSFLKRHLGKSVDGNLKVDLLPTA